jgi:pectate lyase
VNAKIAVKLNKPFYRQPEGKFAYAINLQQLMTIADNVTYNERSPLLVYENGHLLGPAHSPHEEIRELGEGRYSHWDTGIIFSASDNSDPNSNRRTYWAVVPNDRE